MEKQFEHKATYYNESIDKWRKNLAFCVQEVKVLNRYLADVIANNPSLTTKDDFPQFQAKLVVATERAAELTAEIQTYENEFLSDALTGHMPEALVAIEEKVTTFCSSYTGLKSNLVRFLAKSDIVL